MAIPETGPVNAVTQSCPRQPSARISPRACGRPLGSTVLSRCDMRPGQLSCESRLRSRSGPMSLRRVAAHYPLGMVDAVAEARQLIRIIDDDRKLPRSVRGRARALGSLVPSKPGLVLDLLEELRERTVPDLALQSPTVDYARCVSVQVFWRYYLHPAQRRTFRTGDMYRRYLEYLDNPVEMIRNGLRDDEPLVPAAHSWLVPVTRISGLDGARTRRRLRIDDEPPYIVMVFPAARMRAAGVEIREPRGLDAIPGRFLQWMPGDVPDERIDQDIPIAALGNLEWRP